MFNLRLIHVPPVTVDSSGSIERKHTSIKLSISQFIFFFIKLEYPFLTNLVDNFHNLLAEQCSVGVISSVQFEHL